MLQVVMTLLLCALAFSPKTAIRMLCMLHGPAWPAVPRDVLMLTALSTSIIAADGHDVTTVWFDRQPQDSHTGVCAYCLGEHGLL